MTNIAKQLNPNNDDDLVWDYNDIEGFIPSEVHKVTDQFNEAAFKKLVDITSSKVLTDSKTGVEYAYLTTKNSSKKTAVIHFNPFGNGMNENMQMRALYIFSVLQAFNIGSINTPMLSFAAPSGNPSIKLSKEFHDSISKGDFSLLAKKYLKTIKKHGFEELLIVGFSQGATIASSVAIEAVKANVKVTHLAIGEPANIFDRKLLALARTFMKSGKGNKKAIDDSGVHHMKKFYISDNKKEIRRNYFKMKKLNLNLAKGLSQDTFINDLKELVDTDIKLTIAYSDLNKICPPTVIRRIVYEHRARINDGTVQMVRLKNADHAWNDRLNLLATYYAYALSR